MSAITNDSNCIANTLINSLLNNFQHELVVKEVSIKIPQNSQQKTMELTKTILMSNNLPKPNIKKQFPLYEDSMPYEPTVENLLQGKTPILRKRQLQFIQTANSFNTSRKKLSTPRYASAAEIQRIKKTIKLNIGDIRENKPIQLNNRSQQATAKSFRSVIELQQNIIKMRSTYLKNLKQQAESKMSTSMSKIIEKKKKIPKQFTFDFSGNILQNKRINRINLVSSSLKKSQISESKIYNKKKVSVQNQEQEVNLQLQLERAPTGFQQKEKRAFGNSSRRQVSHFPFINLIENTKLTQQKSILLGPQSPQQSNISRLSNPKSGFTHYFDKSKPEDLAFKLDTDQGQVPVYPCNYEQRLNIRQVNLNGSILKNSRFFNKSSSKQHKSDSKQPLLQYNPVNVTRDRYIDKYYKIKVNSQDKSAAS